MQRLCPRINKKFKSKEINPTKDVMISEQIDPEENMSAEQNEENPVVIEIDPSVLIEEGGDSERPTYACITCGRRFLKAGYALKHCKIAVKSWRCPRCGKEIAQTTNRARHSKVCMKPSRKNSANVQSFRCVECEKDFATKSTLKRHAREVHMHQTAGIHLCPEVECDYKTDYISQLKRHKTLVHINVDQIECDHCPFFCYSESGLKNHFEVVHNVGNRTCQFCKQVFSSKTKMKVHAFQTHKNGNIQHSVNGPPVIVVKRHLGHHAQYSLEDGPPLDATQDSHDGANDRVGENEPSSEGLGHGELNLEGLNSEALGHGEMNNNGLRHRDDICDDIEESEPSDTV